jgi:NAD(P)-dependent dehydrogenase (short-subunit alcohol dehydrogenase family)
MDLEAEFFEKVRPTSLIKRFATPEEVASLVAYAASPRASATTGAALRVGGGHHQEPALTATAASAGRSAGGPADNRRSGRSG